MARLPSDIDLGGLPSAQSGRPIATYDTTGYARGAAAMGAGLSDLGKGISGGARDVGYALQQQDSRDDALEVARAKSDFLTKKVELETSFKDDQDYETVQERYNKGLAEIRAGSSGLIRNPRTRELFELSTADDVAKGAQWANGHASKIWKDRTVADTQTRMEEIRQAALKTGDPAERDKLIQTGNDLITSIAEKGVINHATAAEYKKKWATGYAQGAIEMLPASERVTVLDGFEGALRKRESGGNPTRVNQLGYAGLYQFGAPRLADMGIYTPGKDEDLATWSKTPGSAPGKWTGTFNIPGRPDIKTVSDFLANPSAQQAAFQIHSQKMDQEIQQNGLEKFIGKTVGGTLITREGLHAMMHLGGAGGARRALESDGRDVAKDVNGASVMDYAKLGVQNPLTRVAGLLPEDTRSKLRNDAQIEVDRSAVKAAMERSELYDRTITDASAGLTTLPDRSVIENDPQLDEPRRNTLLKQYDSAAGDVATLNRIDAKFRDPNGGAFNPYDKDERDAVDKIYKRAGGDAAALQAVFERTGIVPKSAVSEMRGGLVSNDPKKVSSALTIAAALITKNSDAFAGQEGGADLVETAATYRYLRDNLAMSDEDASREIIKERSPEFQRDLRAKLKGEDINEIVKKQLSMNDLENAFDNSWFSRDPKVGFGGEQRNGMFRDYGELFAQEYARHGNIDKAKSRAQDQLKRIWGVTEVNGSKLVTRYPPENAADMRGIDKPSEVIASQAIADIKQLTGKDVKRDKITLLPIPGATAEAFRSRKPQPYTLQWEDELGNIQMLNPGQGWVVNGAKARQLQSEGRQDEFTAATRDAPATAAMWEASRLRTTPDKNLSMAEREKKRELEAAGGWGSRVDKEGKPLVPPEGVIGAVKNFYGPVIDKVLNPGTTRLGKGPRNKLDEGAFAGAPKGGS